MYVWDETKRKSNLKKHGLDFRDAYLVYENPDKCTYDASRDDEYRLMDVALAVVKGRLLTLVYKERDDEVRVISFRNASRTSANNMKKTQSKTDWDRVLALKEGERIPMSRKTVPTTRTTPRLREPSSRRPT